MRCSAPKARDASRATRYWLTDAALLAVLSFFFMFRWISTEAPSLVFVATLIGASAGVWAGADHANRILKQLQGGDALRAERNSFRIDLRIVAVMVAIMASTAFWYLSGGSEGTSLGNLVTVAIWSFLVVFYIAVSGQFRIHENARGVRVVVRGLWRPRYSMETPAGR